MPTLHISAPDSAFAKTVLLPGDPLRAKYIADNYLENVVLVNSVRNNFGYTGLYKGCPVSVMGSGMGMAAIGIYSYELFKFYGVENIIRIGSAGSYTPNLKLMDVVLAKQVYSDSTYALMQNGTSDHILYPSASLNKIILETALSSDIECKQASVLSSDVFYADEEMETWQQLSRRTQTDCVEMEAFALFHNANVLGRQAATLLTISDCFWSEERLSSDQRQIALRKMILLALESVVALSRQP